METGSIIEGVRPGEKGVTSPRRMPLYDPELLAFDMLDAEPTRPMPSSVELDEIEEWFVAPPHQNPNPSHNASRRRDISRPPTVGW